MGGFGASTYRFAPRHSLKNFVRRGIILYLNPVTSFFLKGSRPSPLPPIPFFQIPPPQKIRMERSGKARGRDARYSARGGVLGDRGALGGFKPPRTRRVRNQGFCWKWVLTFWYNDHKIQNTCPAAGFLILWKTERCFALAKPRVGVAWRLRDGANELVTTDN